MSLFEKKRQIIKFGYKKSPILFGVGDIFRTRTDVMYTYIVQCWLSNGLSCYYEKNEYRSALSSDFRKTFFTCVPGG